jgi:23S rRNA 5-hydroxycytidine C2501 synthase
MMKGRTTLELLSPARDLECGLAAVNHGADAVYIGAPKFGARSAAGNSLKDIGHLISYAHQYWARVYVTVNTILFDHELEEVRLLIHALYNAGADAIIFQDMGLLELGLPPIPLFASTQTHNYEVDKIRFLERVGIQRVILARELSLKQIAEIRKSVGLELEFFVHGALCVSFSGQCYISQATQGRSANRGECAQMCRLPYTLTDARGTVLANNQHVLSLRDLDLSAYLDDLVNAGVTSFKIEGRLKELTYVKNITAFYRAKLDALMEKRDTFVPSSSGHTVFMFDPDPEKTFNRGTTDYFIRGRRTKMASLGTPKSVGKLLGRVGSVGPGYFVLESPDQLNPGDGICFFNAQDELTGVNINEVDGTRIIPNSMEGINPGSVLYRNFDREFMKQLHTESSSRRIAVDLFFGETDTGFRLRAVDEDGNEVEQQLERTKEIAKNPEAAIDTIRAQLSKLGETVFRTEHVTVDLETTYFLPLSTLNRLRRDCLAALARKRAERFPRQTVTVFPGDDPYPRTSLDYSSNVVNEKAVQFYKRHGVQTIEKGLELETVATGKVLMTTRHCLKYQFDLCRGDHGGAEELFLWYGQVKYALEFDCETCVMKVVSPG